MSTKNEILEMMRQDTRGCFFLSPKEVMNKINKGYLSESFHALLEIQREKVLSAADNWNQGKVDDFVSDTKTVWFCEEICRLVYRANYLLETPKKTGYGVSY